MAKAKDLSTAGFSVVQSGLLSRAATYSEDDVADPPTNAELDTAFGTPESLGAGFIGLLDDNAADTDIWLCATTDAEWYYIQLTKA